MAPDTATSWEGLDHVRGLLTRHWSKLVYLSLAEKEGSGDDRIARLDVRRDDGKGGVAEVYPSQEEGIEALLTQIRTRTERNSIGLQVARFRLNLYGKGSDYIESTTIKVVPGVQSPERASGGGGGGDGFGRLFELPASTVPPITAPEGPAAQSFNILAAGYGTFLEQIVFPSVQRLGDAYHAVLNQATAPLIKQIDRLTDQNGELARELASVRRAEVEGVTAQKSSEADAKARGEIVTTAITEASGLARMFAAMKAGLPPALVDTLSVVGDDERLMRTLQDPRVKLMLSDPANRQQLVELLEGAAAQADADAAAAKQAPPPAAADGAAPPPLPGA